jgi:hypothetical protein
VRAPSRRKRKKTVLKIKQVNIFSCDKVNERLFISKVSNIN